MRLGPAQYPRLLPKNATPLELAVESMFRLQFDDLGEYAERLRTLWDPFTCPESELPLLAWAFSVDIWNERWPAPRKRQVVAEARRFHELKTTVAGTRMALGYVDAELVRAHLPRHGFLVAKGTTEVEYQAWLQSLPEIRIYQNVPSTKSSPPGFVVNRRGIGSARAAVVNRRRAVLIRNGVETDLVFSGVRIDDNGRLLPDAERLVIPEPYRVGFKAGGKVPQPVRTNQSAAVRVISLSITDSNALVVKNQISPSLFPVVVDPVTVYGPVPGGASLAVNRCALRSRPIKANRSDEQAYLSIRLSDGSAPATRGNIRGSALGRGRLQRKSFTASYLVFAPITDYSAGFPRNSMLVRRSPEDRVEEVAHAVDVAASARDTCYIDVNSVRPITFSDLERLPDGTTFGEAVRLS